MTIICFSGSPDPIYIIHGGYSDLGDSTKVLSVPRYSAGRLFTCHSLLQIWQRCECEKYMTPKWFRAQFKALITSEKPSPPPEATETVTVDKIYIVQVSLT